jgi:hypothetical protein
LLQDPRYANASRFFLSELYGPDDFAQRDAQFARIVPALVRLFPHEIVDTVAALAALHALSEALDTEMGRRVASPSIDRNRYIEAWQSTGRPDDRERQISLMLGIGRALDHYTRNPLLRRTLRFMRAPARAAGLGELQSFLERGFDTFGAMRGAQAFLDTVARRERALAARLFGVHVVASETFLPFDAEDPLVQLP